MTRWSRRHKGTDRPVAAAVLQTAAGVTILAIVLAVGSLDGLAISFSATSTPMALFIGFGLIACGISTWVQPTTRILTGILGFAFSLVALPGANLGGFVIGTVLGVLGSAAALAWVPSERRRGKE
ncbi:MAG TPA: hypothetical protein H9755_05685 [Candidatus Dietzia intestinigallinarum]|nr:hypothetical protein [Candidatus Dietzia intestinigallinarum]